MTLAHPEWLWLLTALPLLAWREGVGSARRGRDWAALGQSGRPERTGAVFWTVAAGFLTLALAQPRWGRAPGPPLPPGHDLVLAIDLSRSMAAEDAVPDRLGLAVEAAGDLLKALGATGGDRVAVVGFAGRGALLCPLTENLGAAADILNSLRVGQVQPGGTNLGAALDACLEAFDDRDRAQGRTVVLFSDGEDHPGTWQGPLGRLKDRGVILHAVAVGDAAQGHPVPLTRSDAPDRPAEPLKYRGRVVLSKRTDEPLEALAHATGGALVRLGLAPAPLGSLYRSRIEPLARARRTLRLAPVRVERFGLFLWLALVATLVAAVPVWRPFLRRGTLWGLLLVVPAAGAVPAGLAARALVERGRADYREGRFEAAVGAFRTARSLSGSNPIPFYDEAAALYQSGRFAEAFARYREARQVAGPALRVKIDYALGNTALALGDLAGAVGHYDDCLASQASGADLDRVREAAATNRRFVREKARKAPAPDDAPGESRHQPEPARAQGDAKRGQGQGPSGGTEGGGSPGPSGRNPVGGAGGTGSSPPSPGTPEERLENALENVRKAIERRLEDADPPPSADIQDW